MAGLLLQKSPTQVGGSFVEESWHSQWSAAESWHSGMYILCIYVSCGRILTPTNDQIWHSCLLLQVPKKWSAAEEIEQSSLCLQKSPTQTRVFCRRDLAVHPTALRLLKLQVFLCKKALWYQNMGLWRKKSKNLVFYCKEAQRDRETYNNR